jgi:hypothetical protein
MTPEEPPGEQPKGDNEKKPGPNPNPRTEINADEIKTLLNISIGPDKPDPPKAEQLPNLPKNLHPFRDPRHGKLLGDLEDRRILLLASYQESAAYAAAFSLVHDDKFRAQSRRALFPTRRRDRDRLDFDLVALTNDEFLERPQIVLIEVDTKCTLLESALMLGRGVDGKLCDQLLRRESYLVFAVNEDLLGSEIGTASVRSSFPCYTVSHLRYLLAGHLADRADDFERRLLASIEGGASAMELRELYQRVAEQLAQGVPAFEAFVRELEQASTLPIAARKDRLQPIQPQDVFREESEVHRAAAFVATYFPNVGQRDFDWLVLQILGDETTTTERSRRVIGRDGAPTTVSEDVKERWSERWRRGADRVFSDCHLRAVVSADGSWVIDFSEPYLRRELRAYVEGYSPWYLKRQCQALQDIGALFDLDLSTAAIENLVRLFVERAVADPAGFGSVWLLDLVRGLKIQLNGEAPSDSPEDSLVWLLEKLAVETQLQAHFRGRLALLIREMLDREVLRPMVREFFEFLIAARQHDALLDVILDLARRLRFAPHFNPLYWMRRLLDQGSKDVRQRTAERLITLARESGPRIYEFLAAIRSWLPESGRLSDRFSISNRVALEFLFAYCFDLAESDRFGAWPSRCALFYALPADPAEARREIANLVEWILDPRGAALETTDPSDPTRPAEAVRIGNVAALLEQWAWVLEGSADGPPEGRALFTMLLDEVNRRIGARERSWFQRSWQRRQDDYMRQAASPGDSRPFLLKRHAKLKQLRLRFANLANNQPLATETPQSTGGAVS